MLAGLVGGFQQARQRGPLFIETRLERLACPCQCFVALVIGQCGVGELAVFLLLLGELLPLIFEIGGQPARFVQQRLGFPFVLPGLLVGLARRGQPGLQSFAFAVAIFGQAALFRQGLAIGGQDTLKRLASPSPFPPRGQLVELSELVALGLVLLPLVFGLAPAGFRLLPRLKELSIAFELDALGLVARQFRLQLGQRLLLGPGLLLVGGTGVGVHRQGVRQAGLDGLEGRFGLAHPSIGGLRDLGIVLGIGQALEQFAAFVVVGLEKGGELALGQ